MILSRLCNIYMYSENNMLVGTWLTNTAAELRSEAEERPICSSQMTKPLELCVSKEELLALQKCVIKDAGKTKKYSLLCRNTQKTEIMVVEKDSERKEDFILL